MLEVSICRLVKAGEEQRGVGSADPTARSAVSLWFWNSPRGDGPPTPWAAVLTLWR